MIVAIYEALRFHSPVSSARYTWSLKSTNLELVPFIMIFYTKQNVIYGVIFFLLNNLNLFQPSGLFSRIGQTSFGQLYHFPATIRLWRPRDHWCLLANYFPVRYPRSTLPQVQVIGNTLPAYRRNDNYNKSQLSNVHRNVQFKTLKSLLLSKYCKFILLLQCRSNSWKTFKKDSPVPGRYTDVPVKHLIQNIHVIKFYSRIHYCTHT